MAYAKGILSGLAAILLAEIVPGGPLFSVISTEKATGPAALAGGLVESLFRRCSGSSPFYSSYSFRGRTGLTASF
jgi:hypothetical protein